MPVIEIPGNQKVQLRDPNGLSGIDVENVMGLVGTVGLNPQAVNKTEWFRLIGVMRRALVVTLAVSWTLPGEITMETVGALSARTLKPLYQAIAPAMADVMPEELDPNSVGS